MRCLYIYLVSVFFLFLFLWLTSSFMPLWSENMLEIVSILLNLLRLVLCPRMWLVLENVPCAFEKNACSAFFFWNVESEKHQLSLTVLLYHLGPLLPYWFSVWKICPLIWVECWGLVLFFLPFCLLVFMYLGAPVLGTYMLMSVKYFSCIDPLTLYSLLFYLSLYHLLYFHSFL